VRIQSLPLFPEAWLAPAPVPAEPPPARRGRRGKGKVAEAVIEAVVPAEGSGPLAAPVPPALEPPVRLLAPVEAVEPAPARRPDAGVLVFDVETTGTDRKRDQVIELCMQRGLGGTDHKVWRFKPTVSIHPRAQEVHGISMDDLAGCPSFASCADEIAAWFATAEVIVGYNLAFDVDMLQAEYERAGKAPLDLAGKAVVDPFRLWQQCEPRRLQHAHQRFVGHGFEGAHSAVADVAATGRVLEGMVAAFGLGEHDWESLARVCDPDRQRWIGPSRHLQWEGEAVVLSFGKHQGMPLHVIAAGEHSGYLRWVCDHDFPAHVAEVCTRALELTGDLPALLAWVRERFGPSPGAAAPSSAASAGGAPAGGGAAEVTKALAMGRARGVAAAG
jgi:DNA polymerase-3 subunit epsilon